MALPIRPAYHALSLWSEFRAFLIKQNALALALGVVLGSALNDVVKSLVDGIIMPIVAGVSPDPATFETWRWSLGPVELRPGLVISAAINFFIIGFVAWRLTKLFIKPEAPGPQAATRPCPFCYTTVDARASRCQNCTSELAPTSTA
ncbi:MAG TPA: MscL family protein [Microbacterium sp.]|jgi:large conductance mechanosensitive channel|nr:MscL family protein [Microbacterium sp.]